MKRKAMMLLAGLFTLAVLTLAAPFAVMELGERQGANTKKPRMLRGQWE